jgi:hypothetical protein
VIIVSCSHCAARTHQSAKYHAVFMNLPVMKHVLLAKQMLTSSRAGNAKR